MTLFWIASAILILLSLILMGIPFIRKRTNNDDILRDELNKALYKDGLSELAEETQEGLVDDQQELVDDLKQSLLDDVPHQDKAKGRSSHCYFTAFYSVYYRIVIRHVL